MAQIGIKEFYLLDKAPPIWYDQLEINSCVGDSLAFALSYYFYQYTKKVVKFSPLYIYWHARYLRKRHFSDEGTYIGDGVLATVRWHVCEYKYWPTQNQLVYVQPSPEAYENAYTLRLALNYTTATSLEEIKWYLLNNHLLIIGIYVPESIKRYNAKGEIVLDIPQPGERIAGGHAVVIVGFSDHKEAFLCRNSWGKNWGLEGNFWIKYRVFIEMHQRIVGEVYALTPKILNERGR